MLSQKSKISAKHCFVLQFQKKSFFYGISVICSTTKINKETFVFRLVKSLFEGFFFFSFSENCSLLIGNEITSSTTEFLKCVCGFFEAPVDTIKGFYNYGKRNYYQFFRIANKSCNYGRWELNRLLC